jgi:hypothetical protein
MSTVFASAEDVADNRRLPLQDWLQTVVSMDELFLTFEVGNFLGMYDNLLQPKSASKTKMPSKMPTIVPGLVNFDPKPGTLHTAAGIFDVSY